MILFKIASLSPGKEIIKLLDLHIQWHTRLTISTAIVCETNFYQRKIFMRLVKIIKSLSMLGSSFKNSQAFAERALQNNPKYFVQGPLPVDCR